LQLLKARKVLHLLEPEMLEECLRGAVADRPAGGPAAPAQAHPPGFQEHVERALGNRNTPDLLDLKARDRLVISDDGKRPDGGAAELARFDALLLHEECQIGRSTELPSAADTHEIDAPALVNLAELGKQPLKLYVRRQTILEGRLIERLACGKQQRLKHAQ